MSDIRKELDTNDVRIVGVHLRRKDYRVYANGQYYFDDETVAKWLKSLEPEHRCHFLIFSDEEVTATNFTRGVSLTIMRGNAGEDLYAMSQCEYLFGPLSTFSWTAHFLGRNRYLPITSKEQEVHFEDFKDNVIGIV